MATRTQIYLTEGQRARLDEVGRQEGKSLAALVREAVDEFLGRAKPDREEAIEATFGVAPRLSVPSRDEWDHRG